MRDKCKVRGHNEQTSQTFSVEATRLDAKAALGAHTWQATWRNGQQRGLQTSVLAMDVCAGHHTEDNAAICAACDILWLLLGVILPSFCVISQWV